VKRQVNIRLEEELIEQLKEIAIEEQKKTGYDNITFTNVIEKACREFIKNYGEE